MSTWAKKLPVVAILLAVTIALSPVATAYAISASTGSVTGFVKSANTGAVLSGVTVRVFDMNTAEFIADVLTNDEGVLDLAELPFGLYQITVVAPEGYVPAAGPLVNLTDENPEATVAFNLEALPSAPAPAAIGGVGLLAIVLGITAAAVVGIAIGLSNGEPDVPVGTG